MWFVARRDVVEKMIQDLVGRRVHELFPGYLCLVWTAARAGRVSNLQPDFASFFDYFLRVPGVPPSRPYLRPFVSSIRRTPRTLEGIWYQKNVAGSYSPRSVRPNKPFDEVVVVPRDANAGQGWGLRYNHAQLALERLAFGQRLPVCALSLFLYREFAFEFNDQPSVSGVVDVFRYEFGYQSTVGLPVGGDFETLYEVELAGANTADWFEEFPS
jgi:hypothetical protein